MHPLTVERATVIIEQCRHKKIAVIGDVMLDRYFWGTVSRISPEAPVPVVDIYEESSHLGGASNVAGNLYSLGASPLLIGVIGNDNSGKALTDIAGSMGIETSGLIAEEGRPTTVKTRVLGNNQHITRLDREVRTPISDTTEQQICNLIRESLPTLSGIVLQDYDKGVLTPSLISSVIAMANKADVPVFVDPKLKNFFMYKGVTLFKPNKKETEDALGRKLQTEMDVINAGKELLEQLQSQSVLITLSAKGMMLFEHDDKRSSVPTKARHVADVSGAGDTVIATIAAAVAGGAGLREAATLANFAAGVVCGEPGIVAISPKALLDAIRHDGIDEQRVESSINGK